MKNKITILIIALIAIVAISPLVFAEEGGIPSMPGGDMNGGIGGQDSNINLSAVFEVVGEKLSESGKTFNSDKKDQSAILVKDKGELELDGVTITKTGDSSSEETSNFKGLNAAAVVEEGLLKIQGSGFWIFGSNTKINTNAKGANALFATGENSVIEVSNVEINTEKDSSRGLDATYGGTINAEDIKITTKGLHCAAIATDRGEGTITVKNSVLNTAGKGSPIIYSTGNISLLDSKGKATGSSAAVIEGKNSINLEDTEITTFAYGNVESGIDAAAVMIYQSISGNSSIGTGTFSAENSKIIVDSSSKTYKTAPLFFVTNTNAVIDIENCDFDYGSNLLLNSSGNSGEWGNTGSNGGKTTFNLTDEEISGEIIVDSISSLNLNLKSSILTTQINSAKSNGTIVITLDADSTLKLTGDCYISSITDEKTDFSNIESNNHNIYYDSSKCPSLHGKTFNLNGGGKLIAI